MRYIYSKRVPSMKQNIDRTQEQVLLFYCFLDLFQRRIVLYLILDIQLWKLYFHLILSDQEKDPWIIQFSVWLYLLGRCKERTRYLTSVSTNEKCEQNVWLIRWYNVLHLFRSEAHSLQGNFNQHWCDIWRILYCSEDLEFLSDLINDAQCLS